MPKQSWVTALTPVTILTPDSFSSVVSYEPENMQPHYVLWEIYYIYKLVAWILSALTADLSKTLVSWFLVAMRQASPIEGYKGVEGPFWGRFEAKIEVKDLFTMAWGSTAAVAELASSKEKHASSRTS